MRLLAVIEAGTVTGPAKNLLDFCRRARELPAECRIDVSIATFARAAAGPAASNAFLEAARAARVPADCIFQRSVTDPRTLGELRRICDRFAPDILQTHAIKSHFLMRLSGLWKQRPWVAFHHGYTTTDLKMRLYNQLDRWSLRTPARILTVSRAFERQLVERGVAASRIAVLHNSIDSDWLDALPAGAGPELRRRLGLSDSVRVLLTVGRLSHEKAHTDLIAAVKRLRELDPALPAHVIIVGEGPERARIEAAAREMGVAGSVTLAGQVDDPRPYYAAADAVVLSSLTEGSPNALLEAMAAGVPVVATAVGGIPEIVADEESALLVPARRPAALAAAIARTLAGPEAARGRALRARALIESRHSPQARTRYLADLYHQLVQHAHCH